MAIATRRQPRIPLEELCKLPSFFLPVVSWKGDQVAFYWDKTGRMELHVLDLRTKQVRQVSHGETPRALRRLPKLCTAEPPPDREFSTPKYPLPSSMDLLHVYDTNELSPFAKR